MPDGSLLYQTVDIQAPTKDRLVKAAAKLFTLKGYCATSIDEIANACNIQKPSFYGHFPSKESIALATIESLHHYCQAKIFALAHATELEATVRLQQVSDAVEIFFQERTDYALVGFLATQTIGVLNNLTTPIQAYFNDWIIAFTSILTPFHGASNATKIAQRSLSLLQGTMLMERINIKDKSYRDRLIENLRLCWQVDTHGA
jgi:AcrR family transcriptional regulator